MGSLNEIWAYTLDSLRSEFSETTVEIFFANLTLVSLNGSFAVIESENDFKRDIIEKRYLPAILRHFEKVLGFPITISVRVAQEKQPDAQSKTSKQGEIEPYEATNLTETSSFKMNSFAYTFDTFIVGNSNKMAHAACIAVTNEPAVSYNPLYIYGPSGLGKTHLLYAITNRLKETRPDMKIVYVKGEEFTNEMIENISRNTGAEFRNKYRKADVLLIDDIQFIAGRESTQEEFFHTFNALYENHKQIIITSDQSPKDMKTLEDRLKTRFEWGLLIDIQPPDYELRIAIMKKKAMMLNLDISIEVISFLAENLRNNVRQLEGAIKKLGAQSFLDGSPMTIERAKICIADLIYGSEPSVVTVDKIIEKVSEKYNIPIDEIKGRKRTKEIAMARHISIYLIRKLTDMSLPSIGKLFGRDHSTISSSYNAIDQEIKNDSRFDIEIGDLIKVIRK